MKDTINDYGHILKVGSSVIIRKDLTSNFDYDGLYVHPHMEPFAGTHTSIIEIYEYDDVLRFKLKGIVAWEWNEAMLQPFADKYGENYKVVMSREERVIG